MPRRGGALPVLIFVVACIGCGTQTPKEPPATGVTARPKVSFADLAEIQADLARRRGRPLFVNFWATWCGPCVEEMPRLAALAREYGPGGPEFLGVSLDSFVTGDGEETEKKVRRSLTVAGVAYANWIYRGDQDPILNAFHLPGPIPYSVLYDRAGREVRAWTGPVETDDLRGAIKNLH